MSDTFLVHTPLGDLHRGDTITYKKRDGSFMTARATNVSRTTANLVFARSPRGLARAVAIDDITRITKGTP